MIRINDLHLIFNRDVKALDGIKLEIKSKDFAVIVGANGSGKSTLLNAIAGTVFPQTGTIFIEDNNVSKLKDFQRSKFLSRIFQNPLQGTAPDLNIIDNFRLASLRTKSKGFTIGTKSNFRDKVYDKIKTLNMGLENKLEQSMGTLSGGQRQALTLVMATMDDCKIMLLDEPTAALDPKSSALVMEKANEIIATNNLTAIFITHQLKDAIKYGNRLIMMQEGKISKDLSKDEKAAMKVEDLYNWFQ